MILHRYTRQYGGLFAKQCRSVFSFEECMLYCRRAFRNGPRPGTVQGSTVSDMVQFLNIQNESKSVLIKLLNIMDQFIFFCFYGT